MEEQKKKSKAGRKAIVYNPEELERPPTLFLVCGETGVGKTYRNKAEIRGYMRDNATSGKKGRKVLAFDTNDDDYAEYRTVSPDHLKALTNVSARRIRPFNPDGTPMSLDERKGVVERILKHYRNGLIVLDDIDDYMAGAKGQSMIGALCTVRHKGIDILLAHQSIAKISTTEWQNCTWLRLHHQVDDVTRYRERIPKYYLVRIAQFIVDEQYDLAHAAFTAGAITKEEFEKRKSFFVYVNMRKQKHYGVSRATFIRASKRYIDQEENRKVSLLQQERDWNNHPVFKNRNEAIVKLISDYLRFHEDTPLGDAFE